MIHQIALSDCLDGTSPPSQVLTVSACDDAVFVRICKVDSDAHSEKQTEVAEIAVSLPSLLEALELLARDTDREHLRPYDQDGKTHETRLAGRRLTIAPSGLTSAVGALTTHLRYTTPKPEADR